MNDPQRSTSPGHGYWKLGMGTRDSAAQAGSSFVPVVPYDVDVIIDGWYETDMAAIERHMAAHETIRLISMRKRGAAVTKGFRLRAQ